MTLGYQLLRRFVRFWLNRFFRRIQINGVQNIPEGPVMFAMNHPNNLIDSLMVGYAIERKIHYLATSQMFRNRLLALFLHNVGVIPVYRKQDDPAHSQKNVGTFEACYEVLKQNGAIGIYPEGTTHSELRVKQLKTGAARIALETEKRFRAGVKLIPVGLNFSVRKSFRHDVLISIGSPLIVANYLKSYESDPVEAVEQLTSDLQEGLEKEVLHVEAPELEHLLHEVEAIYKGELIRDLTPLESEIDSFRLSKKLVDGIHFYNHRDPARLLKIHEEVHLYTSKLNQVRLDDAMLQRIASDAPSYFRFLTKIGFLLVGFPVAVWGALNHFLPYQISRSISHKFAQRETDYATIRILSGIVLYTAFYVIQIRLALAYFGWFWASIYGFTLPLFGAFAYYYWDHFGIFRQDLRLFFLKLTRRKLLERLKQKRKQLIAELDQAKEDYLNAIAST